MLFRRKEIVCFDTYGCMAHDWREVRRGFIKKTVNRVEYGSHMPVQYYICKDDAGIFECCVWDCVVGDSSMSARTTHPDEDLTGKVVCIK